jgi:hypothetical protein
MFCVFRLSFEVVKEGRILKKTKHLQNPEDVDYFNQLIPIIPTGSKHE